MPKVEVKHEGGCYSLFVNGQRTIDRESFTVVDRVREELEMPGCHYPSEAWEVARSIDKWLSVN